MVRTNGRPDARYGPRALGRASCLALGLAGLLIAHADVAAQHAHEHGVAEITVALDGNTLAVELKSPLDNFVGFEHAPRNDRQRAAVQRMEEVLSAIERVFRPAPAAGCTPRAVRLDHPYRTAPARGAPATQHTEARATYELHCARPEALDRLEVVAFDAFPRLKRVKAQAAMPAGQRGATLTAGKRTLAL
jgi:hypothetical protein